MCGKIFLKKEKKKKEKESREGNQTTQFTHLNNTELVAKCKIVIFDQKMNTAKGESKISVE